MGLFLASGSSQGEIGEGTVSLCSHYVAVINVEVEVGRGQRLLLCHVEIAIAQFHGGAHGGRIAVSTRSDAPGIASD